ncbi:MAG: hypothetical protein WC858_04555 [Parcubacteria group bacterium]|jgi:hypothetical protein
MLWRFGVFVTAAIFWFPVTRLAGSISVFVMTGVVDKALFAALFAILVILVAIRIITKSWSFVTLPAFLMVGSAFLLALIDSQGERSVFLILATVIFYLLVLASHRLSLYARDMTAKTLYDLAVITTLFSWYVALFGWYLNIAIPTWVLMSISAVVTIFVSYSSFVIHELKTHERWAYATFLAIFLAEITWMQNFWPFGYLTSGVITLIIFYVLWTSIVEYSRDKMSYKRLFFQALFMVLAVVIILLSTKWYPVL